jgi:hypothetical protein
VALYAHTDSHYFASSEASALPLVEALCSAVAHRAKGSVKAAAQLAESVLPWLHGAGSVRGRPGTDRASPARRGARPQRKAVSKALK